MRQPVSSVPLVVDARTGWGFPSLKGGSAVYNYVIYFLNIASFGPRDSNTANL